MTRCARAGGGGRVGRTAASKAPKGQSPVKRPVNRAKRNLAFGEEAGGAGPAVRRSPRKRLRSESGPKADTDPSENTPSKKRQAWILLH